ncbi:MAG: hypothetical protein Q9218_003038 [Villophora microphyllina]
MLQEEEEFQNVFSKLRLPSEPSNVFLFMDGPSPGKGQGSFAKQLIRRGMALFAETPLFSIVSNVTATAVLQERAGLGSDEQQQFDGLDGGPRPSYLERFKRNNFEMHDFTGANPDRQGIFIRLSRFNHSWVPNARFAWIPEANHLILHAVAHIALGQEIFVSYQTFPATMNRQQRQRIINKDWEFVCKCLICDNPSIRCRESEIRRLEIRNLQARIGQNAVLPERQYGDIMSLLRLFEAEGIMFPDRAEAHRRAVNCWYNARNQRSTDGGHRLNCLHNALLHARQELELDIVCNGYKSPVVRSTVLFIRDIRNQM